MATRIDPCPFCRSRHLHISLNGASYCVVCESCRSKGPHRAQLQEAIDRWNQTSGQVPHPSPASAYPERASSQPVRGA